MRNSQAELGRTKALTLGWKVVGEGEGTTPVSWVLCLSRMEEGKGSCPDRSFLFFIFSWVVDCLWLARIAAVRDLRTQRFVYFSLSHPISSVAKHFCLVAKAPHDRSERRAGEGIALMGLPPLCFTPLSLFFPFKTPASQRVQTPACRSLGCRTTPMATRYRRGSGGPLSYTLILAVVGPCPSPDMDLCVLL